MNDNSILSFLDAGSELDFSWIDGIVNDTITTEAVKESEKGMISKYKEEECQKEEIPIQEPVVDLTNLHEPNTSGDVIVDFFKHHGMYQLFARPGRNANWEVCNHSPTKIYKTRKVQVEIPPQKVTNAMVIFRLVGMRVDGRKLCYLSQKEAKDVETTIIRKPLKTDKKTTCVIYIKTKNNPNPEKESEENLYSLCISLSINNNVHTIHSWQFQTPISHKYESSKRGKDMNQHNANAIIFSI